MATVSVLSVLLLASLAFGMPCEQGSTQTDNLKDHLNTLAENVNDTSRDLFDSYCAGHRDVEMFLYGQSCAEYVPPDVDNHTSLPPSTSIRDQLEELYYRAGNYSCTIRTARCLYITMECVGEGQEETCDTASATVLAQDTHPYCSSVGPLYAQVIQNLHSLIIRMRYLPGLSGGECPALDWADTEDRVVDILTSLYGASHLGGLFTHTLEHLEDYCIVVD